MVTRKGKQQTITPLRLMLLLFVLLFFAFSEVMLGSHAFFYRDAGLYTFPLAFHCRESFWNGEMPFWNPLSLCGVPLMAQWNTMMCYPLSLIWLMAPLPWSMTLFLVIHIFIAAVGMYRLAQRMTGSDSGAALAGLVFALNGLTLNGLMWANIIPALAWMPWLFLAVERAIEQRGAKIIVAAFLGAMQMLAGSPEICIFTWTIIGLYLAARVLRGELGWISTSITFMGIVGLITALSAIQLLPFFQLLAHANRSSGFDGSVWAMPPWGIGNFLVPLFRTTPSVMGVFSQDEQQWIASYYLGIGTVLFAMLALRQLRQRQVIFLVGIAILGVVLAMGTNAVIYDLLRKIFPPISFLRYPVKFVVLTAFALPLLAAFGLKQFEDGGLRKQVSVTAGILCGIVGVILLIAFLFPFPKEVWSATLTNGALRIFFLLLIAVLMFFLGKETAKRAWLFAALLLVVGADMLTHAPMFQPSLPTAIYRPMDFEMKEVPRFGSNRAMLSPYMKQAMERAATPDLMNYYLGQRSMLLSNCNLLDAVPKVDGFFPLSLKRATEVQNRIYAGNTNAPLLDFLGVSQMTTDRMFEWTSRATFQPLITGGQLPIFLPDDEIRGRMFSDAFDPTRHVYLPKDLRSRVSVTSNGRVAVHSTHFSAHRISLTAVAEEPSMLVVAQNHYPAWTALVDGNPTEIFVANYAFQAIQLPAGEHLVEFRYEDRRFRIGAVISGLTLAVSLVALLFYRLRRRKFDKTL